MYSINFFTPIHYLKEKTPIHYQKEKTPIHYQKEKTPVQYLQEGVEDYFYLGGKTAYAIPGELLGDSQKVMLEYDNQCSWQRVVLGVIKIISYMTLIIPLIMLVAKAIFRLTHKFHTTREIEEVDSRSSQKKKTNTVIQPPLAGPTIQPEKGKKTSPSSASTESKFDLSYYSTADQITFWDHYLKPYLKALRSDKWDDIQGLRFLIGEFQGIQSELETLLETLGDMPEKYQKVKSVSDFGEALNSITNLHELGESLLTQTKKSLELLQKKIVDKGSSDHSLDIPYKVSGFKNVGNTCYMNSALQPLLAIGNFSGLVPHTPSPKPEHTFKERQAILDSLKDFLNAWEEGKSASELGRKIGALRRQIFKAGLLEGGFVHRHQEYRFQDAGSFFELILHVIGRGFQLEMTRTPVMDSGEVLDTKKSVETTSQGVFYLKFSGSSLQEIVNGHREAADYTFKEADKWRVKHPKTSEKMLLSRYKEMEKIEGPAPELLIVRVKNHVVNLKKDQRIDFAPLFKTPSESSEYQLVGFSQNHYQVHWTSVVYNGSDWMYCSDSTIRKTEHMKKDFKHPANYMIYRKCVK